MIRLLLISTVFFSIHSIASAQSKRKLIWAEEFNYNGLPDSNKWSYEKGYVRNKEAQYYTDKSLRNARVENGMLIIEALFDSAAQTPYTSASLTTIASQKILYGRVEVKAKLPVGRGTWPAIWLLGVDCKTQGWPKCGEIDIMENVGFDSLRIHANIHTEAYNHVKKTNKGNSVIVNNPYDQFHIYAIEWTKNKIDFFIDEQKYFSYAKEANATNAEWPFDKPHYLIINLAIGGGWGGQHGIDNDKFPHTYLIDYVRIYK